MPLFFPSSAIKLSATLLPLPDRFEGAVTITEGCFPESISASKVGSAKGGDPKNATRILFAKLNLKCEAQ